MYANYEVNCRRPLDRPEVGGLIQQARVFDYYSDAKAWFVLMFNEGWSVWLYAGGVPSEHWGPVLAEHGGTR